MKKIIIFDFDGVIADSLETCAKYSLKALAKNKVTQITKKAEYLECFDSNFFQGLIEKGVSKEKIPSITKDFNEDYIAHAKEIGFFNNIIETIKKLKEKFPLFIVSATATKTIQSILGENKNLFREIIGGDKETSKVKRIQSIIKKFPEEEYFYIGDTLGDIIEGKEAGAKTVAVGWGWHHLEKLKTAHPDYTVKKPEDLLKLF